MKRKKLFLLILSSLLVLLVVIGSSFAFYEVLFNEGSTNAIISTKTLGINFTDGPQIVLEKVLPGQTLVKTFSVNNFGTNTVEYSIVIEDVNNSLTRKEDLVYTLSSTNDGAILSETIFPSTDGFIAKNISIPAGVTQDYTLTVVYKNMNLDQSVDMGSNISAVVKLASGLQTFNLTGTAYDSSGNIMTSGYVEVHSDVIKAPIQSDGSFILENVPVGEHEIYIKDNDENVIVQDTFKLIGRKNAIKVENNQISATEDKTISITLNSNNNGVQINLLGSLHTVNLFINNGFSSNSVLTATDGSRTNTVTVTPEDNYHFASISCSNGIEETFENGNLYIENLTTDGSCTINYEIDSKTVEFTVSNGTISETTKTVNYGANVTITTSPDTGYQFKAVNCTNNQTAGYRNGSVTVANVSDNTVCNIEYEIKVYQVFLFVNNGTGTAQHSVNYNNTTSFEVSPFPGHHYSSLSCTNGVTASLTDGVITTSNITSDSGCTLTYDVNNYSVGFVVLNGTGSTTGSANHGFAATFTSSPNEGYHAASISCTNNQTASISGTTVTTGGITADTVCTLTYVINQYSVLLNIPNGTGKLFHSLNYGDSVTFTSSPYEGYKYGSASCDNGASISRNGTTYTVSGVPSSVADGTTIQCSVNYIANTYTVAFKVTNGSKPSNGTVAFGGSKAFTSSPTTGYTYSSSSCNNGATIARSGNTYTVSGVPSSVANGTTITCTISYTDQTKPSTPTGLIVFFPEITATKAGIYIRGQGSTDTVDGSDVTYQFKINNSWVTANASSKDHQFVWNTSNKSTVYTITGVRAIDFAGNVSSALSVSRKITVKRAYIWQLYTFLRSNTNQIISDQPSESEIDAWEANTKAALTAYNIMTGTEGNSTYKSIGANAYAGRLFGGILGRSADNDGKTYVAGLGLQNGTKFLVNSDEAQAIYSAWGIGTGKID